MSGIVEDFIESRAVDGKFRDELLAFDGSIKPHIENIIEQLRPSANTLKAWLNLARDIAARDRHDLASVLGSSEIEEIVSKNSGLSVKERQSQLREYLEEIRFPEVANLHRELNECCRQISSDTGIRLELPKDLEGNSLECTCRFDSPEKAQRLSAQLERVASHPATKRIFAILRGEK